VPAHDDEITAGGPERRAGAAVATADSGNVLSVAYHPAGLTVLLVFRDAKAEAFSSLSGSFQLTQDLGELKLASTSLSTSQSPVP